MNTAKTSKAYVTLRGSSRNAKAVIRDASNPSEQPYAGLAIGHGNGDSTSFELAYSFNEATGEVTVYLSQKAPGKVRADVFKTTFAA